MENILKQIPQSVIEKYDIRVEKNMLLLYSQPKEMFGCFSFSNPEIRVSENEAVVQFMDKNYMFSMYKDVQATYMTII